MLQNLLPPPAFTTWPDILLNVAIAFLLGILISIVYRYTHKGISYSQSFVQTLVLLTFIISIVMMVIGSNIARAFSLVGALSIIRFRTVVKDTRDIAFVFFALAVGMAAGSGSYLVGGIGALFGCAVILGLYWLDYGSKERHYHLLRYRVEADLQDNPVYKEIFDKYCGTVRLVSVRSLRQGQSVEVAQHVKLRGKMRAADLVGELKEIEGIERVVLLVPEEVGTE
ncbi:MAG: DUF4956 domain-containing protein [Candidatus Tritonobacter lacicola]|nr:DUF4956 domain-containing protein [Candidatus Tritonobacter lacicola]